MTGTYIALAVLGLIIALFFISNKLKEKGNPAGEKISAGTLALLFSGLIVYCLFNVYVLITDYSALKNRGQRFNGIIESSNHYMINKHSINFRRSRYSNTINTNAGTFTLNSVREFKPGTEVITVFTSEKPFANYIGTGELSFFSFLFYRFTVVAMLANLAVLAGGVMLIRKQLRIVFEKNNEKKEDTI